MVLSNCHWSWGMDEESHYTENNECEFLSMPKLQLTHWGRVKHICVSELTIIGSDNGLSPGRRQAIIWTNAGILLIGHLGTNFSEILIEIQTFSFKKIDLKMSSGKWRPSCLGLNVLIHLSKSWPQTGCGTLQHDCQELCIENYQIIS